MPAENAAAVEDPIDSEPACWWRGCVTGSAIGAMVGSTRCIVSTRAAAGS
jgi:hypothetical protein